jgi:hypothetical protein
MKPHRQRTTMGPTAAAKELLRSDYPERVRMYVFLAAKGALRGKRRCILCGALGLNTRVYIPHEALRVEHPVYTGIRCYWVCAVHHLLPEDAPAIAEALARRGSR